MCGIAGFIDLQKNSGVWQEKIQKMTSAIAHRGPDSDGFWVNHDSGLVLGHRRLAIVDLSAEGHQPMISHDDRFIIVYNGEVYNFLEIRHELESQGIHFRGNSDTEVILSAFSMWGVKSALQKFVGMFAFVVFDQRDRVLTLVRDRLGEKPLYYGWQGSKFVFASELKSIRAAQFSTLEVDRDALSIFLRHSYVPAPYCIFKGIKKLVPGHFLELDIDSLQKDILPMENPYWSLKANLESGVNNKFQGNEQDAIKRLETLLENSIRKQMIADVPIGAFLSGGVDSSTVVALMQKLSMSSVKTFSLGFNIPDYNEAEYAKQVARHLGTDHTELYIDPQEAMNVISKLPSIYDEPFADSSQIPTYLVSKLAREQVTVSLSGDAGDELFGGYNRYLWGEKIWSNVGWVPTGIRHSTARFIKRFPPQKWESLFNVAGPIVPNFARQRRIGSKMHRMADIIAVDGPEEMYRGLVSHWMDPSSIVLNSAEPQTILNNQSEWSKFDTLTEKMMFLDTVTYLPDDILVKLDRASMAVSLESRVPFLDHQLIEFAWSLPLSMKIKNGQGKWLLRQVLYKYVPKHFIERPKVGFGIPVNEWLKGPLREWGESLISEERLKQGGYFNPKPIREKWECHQRGEGNWGYHLWDILMFQAWLEAWE